MKNLVMLWLFSALPFFVIAQNSISGTVNDQESNALVGAHVVVLETFSRTITNSEGHFKIGALSPGKYLLEFSYIGFNSKKESVVLDETNDKVLTIELDAMTQLTEAVTILATRADETTPTTFTMVEKEEIEKQNLGQDLPFLLNQTPSLVATSDAGAGVGYTGLRIRGTDPTRINVTINGIPLNDAESQGVFWVDLPDLASSVEDIQVQRGVGTSTNGAGAFGGSINIQTTQLVSEKYAEIGNSFGSFGTRKHTLAAGTGLLKNHFTVDARLSKILSDGYIDRASSDLKSLHVLGAYIGPKTSLRFNMLSGRERTYQAWGGVPLQFIDTNRTFNPYDYGDEVDDYGQDHYQLIFNQELSAGLALNASLHYTHGEGFFEQYKGAAHNALFNYNSKEALADYGLSDLIFGTDTISETDLIRRRWLDNDFYGGIFSLHYNKRKVSLIFGGGFHQYDGKHFGEITWTEFASNGTIGHRYYDNDASKSDYNLYAKLNYLLGKNMNIWLDLQWRNVGYEFLGVDNTGLPLNQTASLNFFNPKAGLSYRFNASNSAYASFAVGNKEPNRDDYTESSEDSRPKHETLYNTEVGYKLNLQKLLLQINLFDMTYKNQLVLTGQINDVGAQTRVNIADSYRRGAEVQAGVQLHKNLQLSGNATFSQNKIKEFTEYYDNWDTWGQDSAVHKNTDLSFSPSIIAKGELAWTICSKRAEKADRDLVATLSGRYVGKQFIDNTSNSFAQLDDYFVTDFRVNWSIRKWVFRELLFTVSLNNILNTTYISNAWNYRYVSEGYDARLYDPYAQLEKDAVYSLVGYYPQAQFNFMGGIVVKL